MKTQTNESYSKSTDVVGVTETTQWKKTELKNDIFFQKENKFISVSKTIGTDEWFVFIDNGISKKARVEYARNKQEALKFAQAYMGVTQ